MVESPKYMTEARRKELERKNEGLREELTSTLMLV